MFLNMIQDQHTYTRANTAAAIGLATQLLLFLLLLILGLYAESKAILAGASYLFPGLFVWLLLWVIYRQHRLEHEEALQASQLADNDARSAAIFEEAGAQLAQAKRRLESLYKWGMPITSVAIAVYLVGVGTLLLYLNNRAAGNEALVAAPISESVNASLLALLMVLVSLGGFLVARYVAGMTQVDAWQALRGGASTLIGNVFLGLIPLATATALLFLDNQAGFVYLAIALPIVMIVLGIEILLGLVLGFYRPRKPDEFVRPAFDSRVLGWLTRPESIGKIFSETINYQFGFEVSKSWFMQLLGRALLPLAAVCIAIVIGMTSLVVVEPHQQAVVTTNGRFIRIAEPGISFKLPWPIGRAERHDVVRVHSVRVGSKSHIADDIMSDTPVLWSNQHVPEGTVEKLLITAPPPGVGTGSGVDSSLGEMVGADIDVQYRIDDLAEYVGVKNPTAGTSRPDELLRIIAKHEVTRYFATHDTNYLLSTGRTQAGDILKRSIQDGLDKYAIGLEIVFVSVSGVHPPQEVAADYHARINALQESQTAGQKALQEADVTLATAAGNRDQANQLSVLIDTYYKADAKLKRLTQNAEPSDAEQIRALERSLERQRASIELLMIESGGLVGQRLAEARATRWSTSLSAEARALRLEAELEAFANAPRYYPISRYLDVIVASMADRPKTVLGPNLDDATKPNVVLDLPFGGASGLPN